MLEKDYVKIVLNALTNAGLYAEQKETPRTVGGHYRKKQPVDLVIQSPKATWNVEVKRTYKDNGKLFYWKTLRTDQSIALANIYARGLSCGLLICWDNDKYTYLEFDELSEYCTGLSLKIKDLPENKVLTLSQLVGWFHGKKVN